jgi:hypothetical protein
MKAWLYLVLFVIILTIFSLAGMNTNQTDIYKEWCEETMISAGYSPPALKILKGKHNRVKLVGHCYYIYLKHTCETDMKKSLIYLLSHTISKFKKDIIYYSAVDKMMIHGCVPRSAKAI